MAVDSFSPRRFASRATVRRSGDGSTTLTGPAAPAGLDVTDFLRMGRVVAIVKSTISFGVRATAYGTTKTELARAEVRTIRPHGVSSTAFSCAATAALFSS